MNNTAQTNQEQENLKTLQAYWQAMDRYDIDAALQIVDEACVINAPKSLPYGGNYQGHDECRQFWQVFFQTYDRPQPIDLQLLTSGDYIICLMTLKTRIKRSGAELEMPMAETFKLRNGKLVEIRPYYFDTAKMAELMSAQKLEQENLSGKLEVANGPG